MGARVAEGSSISALLGPTNTGKTHRAVERMLEHHSGTIGLPLRLLAREIYDRVSARVGERAVALVTGEEKRIPPRPRYWVCTVESMPIDRVVDFVAVDEIQLCAHPQRGHVFTDRLLHARGRLETWFMGADTMRPMFEALVPTAQLRRHPRLSRLRAVEPSSSRSLAPRSAVIAFSAQEVYELAEKIRRRRGGAAVVMGALSPRTRNAQVAMYQAGEVDFLVATDAVGMGLNMDVGHVAFASLHKFDGVRRRALSAAEVAQIAGRAGRHTRDGTFGALSPLSLPGDLAFAVEGHKFAPVRRLVWRNSDLDFDSVSGLISSLGRRPSRRELYMVDGAEDFAALELLRQKPEIAARARGAERVSMLWDVCRIPDFRKLLVEHHVGLLGEVYVQLCDRGQLDAHFMHERISRLESDQGDIDALLMRMEFVRTWSYIVNRGDWVADAATWQLRAQRAEDRLSDALHERLMERFVERRGKRRSSSRGRKRPSHRQGASEAVPDGPFAKLAELRDTLAPALEPVERDQFVEALVDASFESFHADPRGYVWFEDELASVRVAAMTPGVDLLHPDVKLFVEREIGAGDAARLLRRLRAWVRDMAEEARGPLSQLGDLSAAGRGLVYQLEKGLGTVRSAEARRQLDKLGEDDRRALDAVDVRFGRRFVYVGSLLSAEAVGRRLALCAASFGRAPLRSPRVPSFPLRRRDADRCELCGYAALGSRGVRVDLAEQLVAYLGKVARRGTFKLPRKVPRMLRCSRHDAERVVIALGYHRTEHGFVRPSR